MLSRLRADNAPLLHCYLLTVEYWLWKSAGQLNRNRAWQDSARSAHGMLASGENPTYVLRPCPAGLRIRAVCIALGAQVQPRTALLNTILVNRRVFTGQRKHPRYPPVLEHLADHVSVNGLKYLLDGTPEERSAATRVPYADDPTTSGQIAFTPEELRAG